MRKWTIVLAVLLIFSITINGVLFVKTNNLNDQLSATKAQLTSTERQLDATENELATTKTELATSESQLTATKKELIDTENTLQDTETHLTTTKNQLEDTNVQLGSTREQLEIAQNTQAQMLSQYSALKSQVDLRFEYIQHSQEFITPDNAIVAAKAWEIAGNFSQDNNEMWRDFKSLYQWVVDNIDYAKDSYSPILPLELGEELAWSQDFWRTPEETLNDEAGDCEDMANLLASLILSYDQQQYGVWGVIVHNQYTGHAAVAIPVAGDNLVILDPAGNYYSGSQTGWIQSYDITTAISDWLSYWSTDMPGAEVDFVFSDDFNREFSSTQEFIDWAKERYN
jgi:peptidoglycan hydrolase CwlO-like protein